MTLRKLEQTLPEGRNRDGLRTSRADLNKVESSDAYRAVIVNLNGRWRVIECRDGCQWILQYRNRAETVAADVWRGRSHCGTREALIRSCDKHVGTIDAGARHDSRALPARVGAEKHNMSQMEVTLVTAAIVPFPVANRRSMILRQAQYAAVPQSRRSRASHPASTDGPTPSDAPKGYRGAVDHARDQLHGDLDPSHAVACRRRGCRMTGPPQDRPWFHRECCHWKALPEGCGLSQGGWLVRPRFLGNCCIAPPGSPCPISAASWLTH